MNKLLTNKITALFMGHMDLDTGKFFPFRKMTWKSQEGTNYLDCTISSIGGAKEFLQLYPKSGSFIEYGEERQYSDISCSPWRNRMPFSRPLEKKYRLLYGFDLNSEVDPIEYAVVSGGYRHGDKDNLFPQIAPDQQGNYNFVFSGIDAWYMPEKNSPEIEKIPVGAKVTLQHPEKEEIQRGEWREHKAPPESIRMKMFAQDQLVGYAPPYIKDLYREFGEKLRVVTCKKNLGASFDEQFLFKATIHQSAGIPFSDGKYRTFSIDS